MVQTYIVTGENEDGWFLQQMTKDELTKYLAVRTGGEYEDGDPIDFDDIKESDNRISVKTKYYRLPHEDFVIIEGDLKSIKPKELVTEVSID